jgi:hypothetical protein
MSIETSNMRMGSGEGGHVVGDISENLGDHREVA